MRGPEPSPKERAPDGSLRWRKRLRVNGWQPGRIYAKRTCIACGREVCRGRYIGIGESVIGGRYLPSGPLCLRHTVVYVAAPCPRCAEPLFVLHGPRLVAPGKLSAGDEYVNKRGEVVRECPMCREPVATDSAALAAPGGQHGQEAADPHRG